ncbi:hypothetical protein A1D22_10320 [Pasteurellaceae bacterium LFhippo2]|nr:hypothetical protein [Pasteurellaceae bacterium LFhippo2]
MSVLRDLLIAGFGNVYHGPKIYTFPDIPSDKLNKAIDGYKKLYLNPEDVIVLVDDTVFGSATDGFMITDDYLYWNPSVGSADYELLTFINSIELKKGFLGSSNVYIDGEEKFSLSQPKYEHVQEVIVKLREILRKYHSLP